MFALAQSYALEPPANPNADDARATTGRQVSKREGCVMSPRRSTNNKLTLARASSCRPTIQTDPT